MLDAAGQADEDYMSSGLKKCPALPAHGHTAHWMGTGTVGVMIAGSD